MKNLFKKVKKALKAAKEKHPDWPFNAVYQASILAEEAGEVTRAANRYVCEGGSLEDLEEELTQTAAMCFRMLDKIEKGECLKTAKVCRIYYADKGCDFNNSHFCDFGYGDLEKSVYLFKKKYPNRKIKAGIFYTDRI